MRLRYGIRSVITSRVNICKVVSLGSKLAGLTLAGLVVYIWIWVWVWERSGVKPAGEIAFEAWFGAPQGFVSGGAHNEGTWRETAV